MKQPAIYIMSNKENGTLYIGVTSDLVKRIYEHKSNIACDFTKRYNCKTLVYYEMHDTMEYATLREKQLKAGSREKKINLIVSMNPNWNDLYESIIG
jgi:putative endonuclease